MAANMTFQPMKYNRFFNKNMSTRVGQTCELFINILNNFL